jgi:hypothetical protein
MIWIVIVSPKYTSSPVSSRELIDSEVFRWSDGLQGTGLDTPGPHGS